MSVLALVLVPLAGALAAGVDPSRARRLVWLALTAATHLALVALAWRGGLGPARFLWLAFDPLGGLVLTFASIVFLAVAAYSVGYLGHEAPRGGRALEPCLLGFLASASVLCLTDHFGVLWVAMEATTLATAPLIYDPRDRHSIEAVWKYLLICSVGIALALLGTFLLALAQGAAVRAPDLLRSTLVAHSRLDPTWFKAAFVFLVVGYGTKVGLAPMHTWLPDAHGEAPSPISALLSGALLNLAFLALLRVTQVGMAIGQHALMAPVLIGFGLASMLIATAMLLRQRSYKRLLAYSSVEHMGILAVGVGLGGAAGYGAVLHMAGASMIKAVLFIVAGNILIEYRSKRIADVTGLLGRLPVSGTLLLIGVFALTGAPPFPLFFSELAILRGAVANGQLVVGIVLVILQLVAFVAIGLQLIAMAQGAPRGAAARTRESPWLVAPAVALLAVTLAIAFHPAAQDAVLAAARAIGGARP